MGPACRSVEEFKGKLGIGSDSAKRKLPGGALPLMLAWEFLTPDPNNQPLSSDELLKETVDFISGDDEFRKRRSAFVEWQHNFIRDGVTDRKSIDRAVEKMRDLLADARTAAKKLALRKVTRYAFQLAPSALGLAAAFAGVPEGLEMAAAGAFISLGSIAVDEALFRSAEQGLPPAAAFVHDARRQFGWN